MGNNSSPNPDASLILAMAFVTTSAGLLWVRTKKGLWLETLTRLLLPLGVGFCADCLLLLVLNIVQPDVEPLSAKGRAFEEHLLYVRTLLDHINKLPFSWQIAILGGLLALTWFFPRWKLVTRFAVFNQWVSGSLIGLTAMTTFTIFSQHALQERAKQDQGAMIQRYELALRKEWDSVAQEVLAKTIDPATNHLWQEVKKRQFITFLRSLEKVATDAPHWQTAPDGPALEQRDRLMNVDYDQKVAEATAEQYTHEALSQPDVSDSLSHLLGSSDKTSTPLPEEAALFRLPNSVSELRAQHRVVDLQERSAQIRAEQADEALKSSTNAIIMLLPIPEFRGLLGAYINRVVELLVDSVSEQIANWSKSIGRHIEASEVIQKLKTSDVSMTMKKLLLPQRWLTIPETKVDGEGLSMTVVSDLENQMEDRARKGVLDTSPKRGNGEVQPPPPAREGLGKLLDERIEEASHPSKDVDER